MDFKSIFGDAALTLEQFAEATKGMKLVDLSSGEYVAKGKYDGIKAELAEAKKTITTLEASNGDTAALQAEIDKYKAAEEKREQEAQKAQRKADMDARFNAVLNGKEFSSEFARDGVYAKFAAAVADPANKGKGDNELFTALTKDVDGIFKAKNGTVNMGGAKGNAGTLSRADILKIKDTEERQRAIAENPTLFGLA